MKYYIQRQLSEYGPYTLADLQRYVAQGSILMTDLARSEGMTEWVPVSQVIGNIPVPVPAPMPGPSAGTVYGGATGYGTVAGSPQAAGSFPVPPDFHWGLVLLLNVVTCTIFWYVWLIVEAVWVRKIKPLSKGPIFLIISVAGSFINGFFNGFTNGINHSRGASPISSLLSLVFIVLYFVGVFTMRSDLEDHYNSVEPINLRLSGVMTFFFAVFYFQHHFSRIAQWKKTGVLAPQG